MTQLGRHSAREDFRNRVANMRIAAALTISISRNPEAHGPQDGIQPSATEVFNRPQPATGLTFSPLFTMLLQLLLHYGALQTVHNLLRFLQIDSEVSAVVLPASRSIVPSLIVACLPSSSTHSTMMFQIISARVSTSPQRGLRDTGRSNAGPYRHRPRRCCLPHRALETSDRRTASNS
jgi:hypothetical protein